jgi:hypothetical protein
MNGHGRRIHVGSQDALPIGKHIDHVRPVLSRSHDPVDLVRRRVVAADGLRRLGRKPHLAQLEVQPVRPAQRAQVDDLACLVCRTRSIGVSV